MTWSDILDAACREAGTPGAALGVIDGGTIEIATTGVRAVADGSAVTARTRFNIGSATKMITAALLVEAAHKGAVDLDVPVAHQSDIMLPAGDLRDGVTPRLLLCHRAGFFGDVFAPDVRGGAPLEVYAARAPSFERTCAPGGLFSYNNAAFALAARLTEIAARTPWLDLVRTALATIGAADVTRGPGVTDDEAVGHAMSLEGLIQISDEPAVAAMAPAGATFRASIIDALTLAQAILDQRAPFSAPTLAQMRHMAPGPTPTFAVAWGLGLQQFDTAGALIGHDGATPGQFSFFRLAPARRQGLVLLCNGGDARWLAHLIARAAAARIDFPVAAAWGESRQTLDARDLARCGRYAAGGYEVRVGRDGDRLSAAFAAPDANGDLVQSFAAPLEPSAHDPTGELYLATMPGSRAPAHQRFVVDANAREFLIFRGRLFPKRSGDSA
ncbi:MAG: beta-lactamase family protein [Alphaproteobacteria bacterium]|nr:beta-lactamase family protein [Alphaproteobacteria bacterium]